MIPSTETAARRGYTDDSNLNPKYPNNLYIAPGNLQDLEEEVGRARRGQKSEIGAQMFMVALKIMHEATQYGVLKHKGETAFWNLEGSGGVFGGDQGTRWEEIAFKRFSYKNGGSNPADRGEVFQYYYQNYNPSKMVGMTMASSLLYNLSMFMVYSTPTTGGGSLKKVDSPYHPHKFKGKE